MVIDAFLFPGFLSVPAPNLRTAALLQFLHLFHVPERSRLLLLRLVEARLLSVSKSSAPAAESWQVKAAVMVSCSQNNTIHRDGRNRCLDEFFLVFVCVEHRRRGRPTGTCCSRPTRIGNVVAAAKTQSFAWKKGCDRISHVKTLVRQVRFVFMSRINESLKVGSFPAHSLHG
jgi:hypothetical protein